MASQQGTPRRTVLQIGTGLAAAVAGKCLADSGARVLRVEPPGGSPLQSRPPFTESGDSAWFRYLCRDTALIDASALRELASPPDVVITDATPALHTVAWPASTVVIELSAYGSGPYQGWRASELTTWALGGYLSFTGAPDREPLWLSGGQAALHAGMQAAFAALVALHERDHSGLGQRVAVSELESVLAAHAWLVSSWAACGEVLPRVASDLIAASDGWFYVMRIVPNDNLFVLIERPDLIAEELSADLLRWNDNIPRIFAAVAEWAAERKVADIVELGQLLRVPVTPVLDAARLAQDEQLDARDWWQRDEATGLRLPGRPFRVTKAAGPAPGRPRGSGAGRASGGPLAGLRVVEVTNNWAGPLAGRMLADLGADVVKIEWATRPATRALFWAGPTKDLEPDGHERSLYFHELNRNKRDLVLDLSQPAGRATFLRLIADADVFIENQSARVMPNLGLDWEALSAVNPGLIMLSMSGYGATGPHRDWVAYGSNIETTSGLTSTTGYHDGLLSRTTLYYADPTSGLHGAIAVLGALAGRNEDGLGQWIDLSLNEVGATFSAGALLHHAATGEVPGPCGNDDPRFAPHGVYRCAGTDNWVAIACQHDEDWSQLARLIDGGLAAEESLRTLDGRWAQRRRLDELISAWTAPQSHYRVADKLQKLGVAAAPVLANWQILSDPHIHASGFYAPICHPEIGVYPTSTWPWRFERTPAALWRHGPLFGQDNRAVLLEIGLTESEIEELYATGVTSDQPVLPES